MLTRTPNWVFSPPGALPCLTRAKTLSFHLLSPASLASRSTHLPTTCSVSLKKSCGFPFFASWTIRRRLHKPLEIALQAAISIWPKMNGWNQFVSKADENSCVRFRPWGLFFFHWSSLNWRRGQKLSAFIQADDLSSLASKSSSSRVAHFRFYSDDVSKQCCFCLLLITYTLTWDPSVRHSLLLLTITVLLLASVLF